MAPWPGKCLTQAATFTDCRPWTAATVCLATSSGSSPNDLVPITGLSASVLTSASGAMSRLMPQAASSEPIAR